MFGFVVHLREEGGKKGGKEGGEREGRGKEGEKEEKEGGKGEKEEGVTHVAGIGRHYVRTYDGESGKSDSGMQLCRCDQV